MSRNLIFREEARLPTVGDIFLIWDELGVGGGGDGQLPKKLMHKENARKNISTCTSTFIELIKSVRHHINCKIIKAKNKVHMYIRIN